MLGINQIYLSLKNVAEKFSANMQEVNLRKIYNFQFILLTLLYRAPSLRRVFLFQDLWSRSLAAHTHTHYTSSTPH